MSTVPIATGPAETPVQYATPIVNRSKALIFEGEMFGICATPEIAATTKRFLESAHWRSMPMGKGVRE